MCCEESGELGGLIVKNLEVLVLEWIKVEINVEVGDLFLFVVDIWDVICWILNGFWCWLGVELKLYDF